MFCSQRWKFLEKGSKACGFLQMSVGPVGKDGPGGRLRVEAAGPAVCLIRETPDATAAGPRRGEQGPEVWPVGPLCRHFGLECVGESVGETKGFVLECVSCRTSDGQCPVEVRVGLRLPGPWGLLGLRPPSPALFRAGTPTSSGDCPLANGAGPQRGQMCPTPGHGVLWCA